MWKRRGSFAGAAGLIILAAGTSGGRAAERSVFLGGTSADFCTAIVDPAAMGPLRATGIVGLYQHANGMAVCSPAQRSAIWRFWGGTSDGDPDSVGEVGGATPVPPGYAAFFGGAYPHDVDMNVVSGAGIGSGRYTAGPGDAKPGTRYSGYFTAADVQTVQAAVAAAKAVGAQTAAPFISPNGGGEDLDDPFATAPLWLHARDVARVGGGFALDVPPTFAFARPSGDKYIAIIEQMIAWGVANHLRVTVVVSPHALQPDAAGNRGGQGYDPALLENTLRLVAQFEAAGVWPTQWGVETYDGWAPGSAASGNGIENPLHQTQPPRESLANVALALARASLTHAAGTAK